MIPASLAAAAGSTSSTPAASPYLQPNESWIAIGGTVKNVRADAFTLDYGDGIVTVEMDDGDHDADGYKLLEGDKVTVHGRIDDDFFETTKIEAGSVFVEKLGTYFYASSMDEEDWVFESFVVAPVVASSVTVQGTVTEVGPGQFKVNTGLRSLEVETQGLSYDPLDDEGYPKIETGDIVRVTGKMDSNVFEGRELAAESVVKLSL